MAIQQKYEDQFHTWTSCNESPIGLDYTLSCTFPMQGMDHVDAMTVYCKDTTVDPHWDKEWMKKWGSVNISKLSNKEFGDYIRSAVLIPAFTVQYFSYHVRNKKGFVFAKRGPYSPWANECRRIFPDLEQ